MKRTAEAKVVWQLRLSVVRFTNSTEPTASPSAEAPGYSLSVRFADEEKILLRQSRHHSRSTICWMALGLYVNGTKKLVTPSKRELDSFLLTIRFKLDQNASQIAPGFYPTDLASGNDVFQIIHLGKEHQIEWEHRANNQRIPTHGNRQAIARAAKLRQHIFLRSPGNPSFGKRYILLRNDRIILTIDRPVKNGSNYENESRYESRNY